MATGFDRTAISFSLPSYASQVVYYLKHKQRCPTETVRQETYVPPPMIVWFSREGALTLQVLSSIELPRICSREIIGVASPSTAEQEADCTRPGSCSHLGIRWVQATHHPQKPVLPTNDIFKRIILTNRFRLHPCRVAYLKGRKPIPLKPVLGGTRQ